MTDFGGIYTDIPPVATPLILLCNTMPAQYMLLSCVGGCLYVSKFSEISDNISDMVQDKDIVPMTD